MKSIPSALASHLAGEMTTLATCVRITRPDSVVLALSDHDETLIVDGVTYLPGGYSPTDVEGGSALEVDNAEVHAFRTTGMLKSDAISDEDLHAGLWDHAQFEWFRLNWADLTHKEILLTGNLGEVSLE